MAYCGSRANLSKAQVSHEKPRMLKVDCKRKSIKSLLNRPRGRNSTIAVGYQGEDVRPALRMIETFCFSRFRHIMYNNSRRFSVEGTDNTDVFNQNGMSLRRRSSASRWLGDVNGNRAESTIEDWLDGLWGQDPMQNSRLDLPTQSQDASRRLTNIPPGTRSFSISELLPLVEPEQVVEDSGLAINTQEALWNNSNNANQQNMYQQNFQNRNMQGTEVGSKRKNSARNMHSDSTVQQMFGSAEIDFEPTCVFGPSFRRKQVSIVASKSKD
eukprot:767838-Hanusia_phi.AAC.3